MSKKTETSRVNRRQNTKKGPTSGKKKKKMILRIFLGMVILGVIALLSGVGLFLYYAKDAEKLDDSLLNATSSSSLYTANNEFFEDLGSEKRQLIQSTDVPQLLIDAIVSVEDKRFYQHHGFDPIRILGSAISNLTTGGRQGGSTLTQQLIKLSYFSTSESDQTIKRKSQEAWLAWQLENEKSKEEILTYYINKVYMANGLYGMETAANQYYGKTLSELDLPQTALLAGMPQAPSDYDPYQNPELAKERRDVVLYTMHQNDKITKQEYEAALATPIDADLQPPLQQANENEKINQNFIDEVRKEVEEKTGKNVYTDGLKIFTTIDMDAQKKLYEIINSDDYVDYPDDDLQVASTVIDVKTGQVRAQIGGRKTPDDNTLPDNLALNVKRDVGSTMKPLIDYGPAIEYLNYSTGKILIDEPTNYPGTKIPVNNADLSYYGPITMRKAIMNSRNTTAVKTFEAVGKDNATEFLNNLGINFETLVDSNAISSNTATDDEKYGVSSLKLAAAYAAFANNGIYNEPTYVTKVIYPDGTEDVFDTNSKRAMKESTAYMMNDMLKDVISGGTAFNANIPDLIQAGKTGTANYSDEELENLTVDSYSSVSPDSTFVGYTPHYAVSVWTGYTDRNRPVPSTYWGTASDVYREMMMFLSENVSNDDWKKPDSVVLYGNELYVKNATENAGTESSKNSSYYNYQQDDTYNTPAQDNSYYYKNNQNATNNQEEQTNQNAPDYQNENNNNEQNTVTPSPPSSDEEENTDDSEPPSSSEEVTPPDNYP